MAYNVGMKKIVLKSEFVYLGAIVLLSFAVAMITTTNMGLSMIVAPAFILSEKVSFLTFGQAEYVVQFILFILLCLLLRQFKLSFFFSFITGVIYGFVLDGWRVLIPHFRPEMQGLLPLWLRLIYFVAGMLLTCLSIVLFFKTYLYPQVYDFFVKIVSGRFHLDRGKFKRIFDASFFALSLIMTFLLFGKLVGVGWGTLVMTVLNGIIIGFIDRQFDRFFVCEPIFKKFARQFPQE